MAAEIGREQGQVREADLPIAVDVGPDAVMIAGYRPAEHGGEIVPVGQGHLVVGLGLPIDIGVAGYVAGQHEAVAGRA